MVVSRINNSYHYPESSQPYTGDMNRDLQVYTFELYGRDVDVMIGYGDTESYPETDIFPVYILTDNKYYKMIGLFEIPSDHGNMYKDDKNELDIGRAGDPLLFHFAKTYINKSGSIQVKKTKKRTNVRTTNNTTNVRTNNTTNAIIKINSKLFNSRQSTLPTQSIQLCDRESIHNRTKKPPHTRGNWIGRVFNSSVLQIRPNTSTDMDIVDCILVAVRRSIDHSTSPTSIQIRTAISNNVSDIEFDSMKSYLESYNSISNSIRSKKSILSEKNESLRKDFSLTKDISRHKIFLDNSKRNAVDYRFLTSAQTTLDRIVTLCGLSNERTDAHDLTHIYSEFNIFKDSIRLADVSIDHRQIWLDLLEQCCGIGIIVITFDDMDGEAPYKIKSSKHVTNTDTVAPIMIVAYDGNQYNIVSYKEVTLFTLKSLPHRIKCALYDTVITNTPNVPVVLICDSNTNEIPGFADGEYVDLDLFLNVGDESFNEFDTGITNISPTEESFLSYIQLVNIPNWRNKLSDDGVCNILLDKRTWSSISHYMAAIPFKQYPEYFSVFAAESKSDVSVDTSLINKHVESISKTIKPNIIHKDELHKEYERIIREKFKQNPDLITILKLTRSATLVRYNNRYYNGPKKISIDTTLMSIRDSAV